MVGRKWIAPMGFSLLLLISASVIQLTGQKAQADSEPEILTIERTHTEYIAIPEPVMVEVEKFVYLDTPSIAQEQNHRYGGITITPEERELLARLLWREARGEKSLGMRLVAEVVLNRVLSEHFPNTVYEVLYQPGQFTPYDGALELSEITPTREQYDAVDLALTETPITDPDVVFFATTPIYGEIFLHVGGHYFTRYPAGE